VGAGPGLVQAVLWKFLGKSLPHYLAECVWLEAAVLISKALKCLTADGSRTVNNTAGIAPWNVSFRGHPFLIQRLGAIGVQPDIVRAREWLNKN
jgi:hypothetical protein